MLMIMLKIIPINLILLFILSNYNFNWCQIEFIFLIVMNNIYAKLILFITLNCLLACLLTHLYTLQWEAEDGSDKRRMNNDMKFIIHWNSNIFNSESLLTIHISLYNVIRLPYEWVTYSRFTFPKFESIIFCIYTLYQAKANHSCF